MAAMKCFGLAVTASVHVMPSIAIKDLSWALARRNDSAIQALSTTFQRGVMHWHSMAYNRQ